MYRTAWPGPNRFPPIAYNPRMNESADPQPPLRDSARILLVTATAGYRHESIPAIWRALPQVARASWTMSVDTILKDVDDLPYLTPELLAQHEILCFAHTSGELPLTSDQKQAILDFVAAGNGFVGIHGATTICYDWLEYGEMLGAQFKSHPPAATFDVILEDSDHPATRHLLPGIEVTDELYTFRTEPGEDVHVLLRAAPGSLELEGDLPLVWTKTYGAGRVYYNALGHFDAAWDDPDFRGQLRGGLRWAGRLEE